MKKKFNKTQIKYIKKMLSKIEDAEDDYVVALHAIEVWLQEKTGVDIEIFHVDGSFVGFGDYHREYELLHAPELKYWEEL